jgi:hypothetical protein
LMQHKRKSICQEELEQRIVHGLACEWDAARILLTPDIQRQIRRPLFRLSDMKECLGYWSASKREICLSIDFVLNHPWDSIKDVLLHEMAHQLASEVLSGENASGHGPIFQDACLLVRANPKASGKYKTLREQIQLDSVATEDKIMIRIKKLMALAESRNQNEAEAAMAKARLLIQKYNVQLIQTDAKRGYKSIFLGFPRLRHSSDEYHLANLIIDYYFVKGVWVSAFVLDKGKMGRVLEVSGTDKNLMIAEYVYMFIKAYSNRKWDEYKVGKSYNQYHRIDFATGIIKGFRQKLEDQDNGRSAVEGREMVVIEDSRLMQFIDYKYPNLKTTFKKSGYRSPDVVTDGMAIGRDLVISKGISESSRVAPYLLEER